MNIRIVTLFPEYFEGPLSSGLMGKAREQGLVNFSFHNPRDFAEGRHKNVDDRPFGGGPGMVMLAAPLAALLRNIGVPPKNAADAKAGRHIVLAPKGRPFDQSAARELAAAPELTLICGRYEGIDARLEEAFPLEAFSVGDFVLNGGEAAAVCVAEAVCRLLPGFMGHEASGDDESFSAGLLEYPHFTRPEVFEGMPVPQVLLSGDHARINAWRRRASLQVTLRRRPELLREAPLESDDIAFLRDLPQTARGGNCYAALVHYPVLDKDKNSAAVSLTNLDIHDIARSSCTYGLGRYFVVTPLEDQQALLAEILEHWTKGAGSRSNPHRDKALSLVEGVLSVKEAVQRVTELTGQRPKVFGTAAQPSKTRPGISFSAAAESLDKEPALLLFGTGHGLSPELDALCDGFLPPLRRLSRYNHLSVRSAAAITLDRIFGERL